MFDFCFTEPNMLNRVILSLDGVVKEGESAEVLEENEWQEHCEGRLIRSGIVMECKQGLHSVFTRYYSRVRVLG